MTKFVVFAPTGITLRPPMRLKLTSRQSGDRTHQVRETEENSGEFDVVTETQFKKGEVIDFVTKPTKGLLELLAAPGADISAGAAHRVAEAEKQVAKDKAAKAPEAKPAAAAAAAKK